MKRYLASVAALAVAGFFVVPASATDSVTVNGMTFTCTNSCNVSTSNGTTTVTDCCGGRVSGTFPVASKVEE